MSAVNGNEFDLVRAVFAPNSPVLEQYQTEIERKRKAAVKRARRDRRFHFVLRVRLFPKVQDRLYALEQQRERQNYSIEHLDRQVRLLREAVLQREEWIADYRAKLGDGRPD